MLRALCISLCLLAPLAARGADSPDLRLADEAVARNPDLRRLVEQQQALQHRVAAAARWEDPRLALELSQLPWDSWALDESPMAGVQLRLEQAWPFPGKNARREAEAAQVASVKRWELAEAQVQLRGQVRRSFWRLALTRRLEALTQTHLALVETLLAAVRAKYEVGRGAQHDVLRLELLRDRLRDDLRDFPRDIQQLRAALNATLHRTPGEEILTPERIAEPGAPKGLEALEATARERRPLLAWWRARAEAARLSAERADHERWPDIRTWAGWRFRRNAGADGGVDLFSLGVAVPLPIDYTGRAAATRAAHLGDASAADAGHTAALDAVRAELAAAAAAWRRATQRAERYTTGLIPKARATLDAMTAAYQTDRADFASLYGAQLQLLELERSLRRTRFAAMDAAIRVAVATGEGAP